MIRLVELKSVDGEDGFMSVIIISSDLNHIEWEIMGIVGYKCPGIPAVFMGDNRSAGQLPFLCGPFLAAFLTQLSKVTMSALNYGYDKTTVVLSDY